MNLICADICSEFDLGVAGGSPVYRGEFACYVMYACLSVCLSWLVYVCVYDPSIMSRSFAPYITTPVPHSCSTAEQNR